MRDLEAIKTDRVKKNIQPGKPLCGMKTFCKKMGEKLPDKEKAKLCREICRDIGDHVCRALTYVYIGIIRASRADAGLIRRWYRAGVLDYDDLQIIGEGVKHGT